MGDSMDANPAAMMSMIDGFPVITTDYTYGRVTGITTLESAEKLDLDAELFAAPADYVEEDLMKQGF